MERGEYYNLRDSTNMELIAIVNAALNGGNGCELIHIDGKPMYAAYARLDTVGMAQLLVVSEESLQRGAVELLEKTDAIFKETQRTIALRLVRTQLIMSLFIPILILIAVFISLMQAERLSRPIRELNRAGLAFIERTKTDYKRAPVYFKDLNIHTGDEYPAIRGADGRYALFHDPRGFVIGGFEGMNYENYTFTLKKGDSLFVYTDGVPEATDAKGELFGEERMIDALNASAASASPQEILADVKAAVDAFVGKAEQFDDLTMLCVRYQA